MADGSAAETFTPAAIEALKAFPIEPDGLELVALAENVTYRVVDRRDGAAYVLRLHRGAWHQPPILRLGGPTPNAGGG